MNMTGHGFRSRGIHVPDRAGSAPGLIGAPAGHAERNQVRSAYNKAQRLPERRKMMQAWADTLDGLRARRVVTVSAIRRRRDRLKDRCLSGKTHHGWPPISAVYPLGDYREATPRSPNTSSRS